MAKPGYTLTRQAFWASFILAWGVIVVILVGALYEHNKVVDLADIVVPSMVFMIAALLGIHRAFGAIDLRTTHRRGRGASAGSRGGEEEDGA